MKFRVTIFSFLGSLLCLFWANNGAAQKVGVKADRNHILIGERINYDLLIDLPGPGYAVNLLLPDTIPYFELISTKPFDSSTNGGRFLLHKQIVFTSFDSGSRVIPSFNVEVGNQNKKLQLKTQPLAVEVGYAPSDTTGLKDIKPNMMVTVSDSRWGYLLAIVLVVLIIAALLVFYFSRKKKKPEPLFHAKLSAVDEASQALDALQWRGDDRGSAVDYHDALSGIYKRYYSRRENANMLTKTTGYLLQALKNNHVQAEVVSAIAEALREADAVKFARFIPQKEEAEDKKQKLKRAIQNLHQQDNQPSV